jgi:hypothetical protein
MISNSTIAGPEVVRKRGPDEDDVMHSWTSGNRPSTGRQRLRNKLEQPEE